jgi:hypothetical protein
MNDRIANIPLSLTLEDVLIIFGKISRLTSVKSKSRSAAKQYNSIILHIVFCEKSEVFLMDSKALMLAGTN